MADIWKDEEEKFLQAIENVKIPNHVLEDVPYIKLKSIEDFDKITSGGGCYWIWTNEPVLHSLHKNPQPEPFDGGQIIYNGIAKDDVKGRVKHHLIGAKDAGWSGISIDLYFEKTDSHRKKAFSSKGKVPYINSAKTVKRSIPLKGIKKGDVIIESVPIRKKSDLLKIFLSDLERQNVEQFAGKELYFRNGIDITEDKHSTYEFRAYFITGLSSLYLDFIEKKWREEYGLPKLCSYSSGR